MKKCVICLSFFVVFMIFAGCSKVVASSADELMMTERWAETVSGAKAELKFYDGMGELSIKLPDEKEPVIIKGKACADDKKFYITMQEYGKTYAFSYKIYGEKVEVGYAGESLFFYPTEEEDNTLSNGMKN